MPAVVQLENDSQYSSVYHLLRIFLTQNLDSYLEYQAANSSLLKDYGLVHDDCVTKMRLMSLVDLGSNESGWMTYAVIRDTLQLNDDEVEFWVVKAISAKLLECKMDQMNQVVIVCGCRERVFGQRQWDLLRAKLETWKVFISTNLEKFSRITLEENVASVMVTIQANKVTDDVTQVAQGMMTIR
ncbi:hypothetical protein SAY86_024494 [Trapa natans]|uniref:PCI domain-containing protein n=1 Tax=Trapa natans TaxID=22666 RepID=A0AAN7RBJ8_TRANT|nr:hypothetical protein SAY86_024494 [Trapa natans]